jgi:hypothetical protein
VKGRGQPSDGSGHAQGQEQQDAGQHHGAGKQVTMPTVCWVRTEARATPAPSVAMIAQCRLGSRA